MKYVFFVVFILNMNLLFSQAEEDYFNFYSFLCDTLIKVDSEYENQAFRLFIVDENTLLSRVEFFDEVNCSLNYCKTTSKVFNEGGWSYFSVNKIDVNQKRILIDLQYHFSEGRNNPNNRNVIYNFVYYFDE